MMYGFRMYALNGQNQVEIPPSGNRPRQEWEAWNDVSSMTVLTGNGMGTKPIDKAKAAQMYIQSVRSFINWRRAKYRVNTNRDDRS